MPNLGPATTVTSNTVATLTPVNTTTNPGPQESNQLRLIAAFRGVSLSGTGDVATAAVINAGTWAAATTIITNGLVNGVSATVATANLGVFTAAGATGTTIRTAGVLGGQTASTVVTVAAAATTNVALTTQTIYLNQTVAVAGGTVDIFIYGYDLT